MIYPIGKEIRRNTDVQRRSFDITLHKSSKVSIGWCLFMFHDEKNLF